MTASQVHPCRIEHVGKARNGKPRYWCTTHGASATARYGARLAECEAAYRDIVLDDVLDLDETQFGGGIAIWGAVDPVYNTATQPVDRGIHVHARRELNGPKQIDKTFAAVSISYVPRLPEERRAIITNHAAISHFISNHLGCEITHLFCTYCGEVHLDADYFAAHPHRKHLCHACGKLFLDSKRQVSNPISLLRARRESGEHGRRVERPGRSLAFEQREYPGGAQIWASNPAILWTADRAEEEGIHLHLYDGRSNMPVVDDTYSSVVVDGVHLNEVMLRQLMAQRAVSYLGNKLVSLKCPNCSQPHFDAGTLGFHPHKDHLCEHCGANFVVLGKPQLTVSNPLLSVLADLEENAPGGAKS